MSTPEVKYKQRIEKYNKLIDKQKKTINVFSNLRLLAFVLGVALTGIFYHYKNYYVSGGLFVLFLILFISLVIIHDKVINNKNYASILYEINKNGLKRINNEWHDFEDSGEDFINTEHRYSYDLDIFGKGSLFQLINTANTFHGRKKLSEILAKTPHDKNEVVKRQAAVKELSQCLGWRQNFETESKLISDKSLDIDRLINWAEKRNSLYSNKWVIVGIRLLPLTTAVLFIVFITTSLIPYYFFLISLILQIILLWINITERSRILEEVFTFEDNIKAYGRILGLIEKRRFKSVLLNELKERINNSGDKPSKQIKNLEKISIAISYRRSSIYVLLNILFLWDYKCLISLEKWKNESGKLLRLWIETIGEFEALSSLSVINHDHPSWCIPEILDNDPYLFSKKLGHPLIFKPVLNDLRIMKPDKILVITGSNMSGKSTLLRTAGINTVMAYAGMAVCAEEFTCSIMNIYTCMRVSDNLEKNISSFYAELLRIKEVVKAADREEKILFLLDEIFKGTNSIDRHMGAKVLIKQLSSKNTIGMVSTHDLELGSLEGENSSIRNYHLREYYHNNELKFDYILHPGVSTTRNAMYLIKMAGIETEE